jgi:Mg2+ and Co2+ transporter CorA
MWSNHLGTARLYANVREELQDMSQYLDSDMLRRTSRTIVRLTVVAILSLIGTTVTGFFGMNLLDETRAPLVEKAFYFGLVAALAVALIVYTITKSGRLAEFLDALAGERFSWRQKLRAFIAVWAKR